MGENNSRPYQLFSGLLSTMAAHLLLLLIIVEPHMDEYNTM